MSTPRTALTHAHESYGRSTRPPFPRPSGRLRSVLLLGATATLTCTVLPGTAAAEPGEAATPDEAARLVAEASHELEVVTEQVNEARELLGQQREEAKVANEAAAAAQDQLDALDAQIRELARTAYTSEGLSQYDLLLTSDSAEDFLSSLGILDAIAGHTNDLAIEVAGAARNAEAAQTAADRAAAEAERALATVTAQQDELEGDIADYQEQFDRLDAEQQQLVAEAHAGEAVSAAEQERLVAQVTADRPAADTRAEIRAETRAAAPPAAAGASGAAQAAVAAAMAQLGDPYVWGAGGPDAFDCSGLTQYAYAAAG